jgi:hypothetical protein
MSHHLKHSKSLAFKNLSLQLHLVHQGQNVASQTISHSVLQFRYAFCLIQIDAKAKSLKFFLFTTLQLFSNFLNSVLP